MNVLNKLSIPMCIMYIGRMVSPLDHQRWSYETQLRAGIETVGHFTQETESP